VRQSGDRGALVVKLRDLKLVEEFAGADAGCCYYPDSMTSITIDRS